MNRILGKYYESEKKRNDEYPPINIEKSEH